MSHDAREGKAGLSTPRIAAPPVIVVAAVIIEGGRVLLSQRKTGTHLAGAWEFPGGKVEPGEDPRAALVRELEEELGIHCEVAEPVEVTFHAYPAKSVLLLFFLARRTDGSPEPRPLDVADVRWALPTELDPELFPPADVAVLARVRALLQR
ncbi:MAG: (deoxy)nucleoside triphosphate pyrophosphohydrolase [Myxococcales bacterium]|nr:(deoxy)nucleoside triphosphate pyrophosphohydrolase [Myxococcales bacterium]